MEGSIQTNLNKKQTNKKPPNYTRTAEITPQGVNCKELQVLFRRMQGTQIRKGMLDQETQNR